MVLCYNSPKKSTHLPITQTWVLAGKSLEKDIQEGLCPCCQAFPVHPAPPSLTSVFFIGSWWPSVMTLLYHSHLWPLPGTWVSILYSKPCHSIGCPHHVIAGSYWALLQWCLNHVILTGCIHGHLKKKNDSPFHKGPAPFLRHSVAVNIILLPPSPHFHGCLSVIGTSSPKSLTFQVSYTGSMNYTEIICILFPQASPHCFSCKPVSPQIHRQPQYQESSHFSWLPSSVFSPASKQSPSPYYRPSSLHFLLSFQQFDSPFLASQISVPMCPPFFPKRKRLCQRRRAVPPCCRKRRKAPRGDEPDRHPTGPTADIPSEVGGPCKST